MFKQISSKRKLYLAIHNYQQVMKKADFYQRVKLLLEGRKQTAVQCSYYWPKDEQQSSFNSFLLNTLKKYIDSYDLIQMLRNKLADSTQKMDCQLFQKLQQLGGRELAKRMALFLSNPSSQQQSISIATQLNSLNDNVVIASEKSVQRKVKRLVSSFNALRTFVISTSKEQYNTGKGLDPRQFKKYEVDRSNYLKHLALQLKKIQQYKKQSLKLRQLLSYHKLPQQAKPTDYCAQLQAILHDYAESKDLLAVLPTILQRLNNKQKDNKPVESLNELIKKLPQERVRSLLTELQKQLSANSPYSPKKQERNITQAKTGQLQRDEAVYPYSISKNAYGLSHKNFKSQIFENQPLFDQRDQIQKLKVQLVQKQKEISRLQSQKRQQVSKSFYQSKLKQLSQKIESQLRQIKAKYSAKQKQMSSQIQRLHFQCKNAELKYREASVRMSSEKAAYSPNHGKVVKTQMAQQSNNKAFQELTAYYQNQIKRQKEVNYMATQVLKKELELQMRNNEALKAILECKPSEKLEEIQRKKLLEQQNKMLSSQQQQARKKLQIDPNFRAPFYNETAKTAKSQLHFSKFN